MAGTGAARSRRWGRMSRGLAAAAITVGTLAGVAQVAGAAGTPMSCAGRQTSTPFSKWFDFHNYFLMPDGSFEGGASNWALSGGAAVVSGNEPFKVAGAADSRSLRIPYGSRAESRTICITSGEQTARFFVNKPAAFGAYLHVDVLARNPSNGWTGTTSFDIWADGFTSGWSPSVTLIVPLLYGWNGNEHITLVFTPKGTAATWGIDDVYMDPFKTT